MPERTLNLPISGNEAVKAVLDKMETAMRRDCYLNPDLAYDYVEATVKYTIKCHDVGEARVVDQEVKLQVGTEPESGVDEFEGETFVEPISPNELREETGQPIPVKGKGNEIKHVPYARKKKA